MRRWFILLLILGVAFALESPVAAAPPKCEENPEAPGCKTEPGGDDAPLAGKSCADDPFAVTFARSEDFVVTVASGQDACIDVSEATRGVWTDESGAPIPWRVAIETSGAVREVFVIPRDSHGPGDSCGGYRFRKSDIPDHFELPGAPGSYANACGTEFAEIIDGEYYQYAQDDHWRDLVEPYGDSEFYEYVESPLAFLVFVRGRGASVTLTVDLPPHGERG